MNPKLYGLVSGHYVYAEIQSAVWTGEDPPSPPLPSSLLPQVENMKVSA